MQSCAGALVRQTAAATQYTQRHKRIVQWWCFAHVVYAVSSMTLISADPVSAVYMHTHAHMLMDRKGVPMARPFVFRTAVRVGTTNHRRVLTLVLMIVENLSVAGTNVSGV